MQSFYALYFFSSSKVYARPIFTHTHALPSTHMAFNHFVLIVRTYKSCNLLIDPPRKLVGLMVSVALLSDEHRWYACLCVCVFTSILHVLNTSSYTIHVFHAISTPHAHANSRFSFPLLIFGFSFLVLLGVFFARLLRMRLIVFVCARLR